MLVEPVSAHRGRSPVPGRAAEESTEDLGDLDRTSAQPVEPVSPHRDRFSAPIGFIDAQETQARRT